MTEQELELNLLLLDSGELSEAEAAELREELLRNPELASRRDEFLVLQEAGRFATRETIPPLPELTRERVLQRAPRTSRVLPRLLAVAAGLVLALALWPHLAPTPTNPADPITAVMPPEAGMNTDLLAAQEDPVLDSLEQLDQELEFLLTADLTSDLALGDANDWAEELLSLEESI